MIKVFIIATIAIIGLLIGALIAQSNEIDKLEREVRWLRKLVREND